MRNSFLLISFLFIALASTACDCTSQVEMSLEYHRSRSVVIGKITKITKSKDQKQLLVTVEVLEDFKGSKKGQSVVVRTNASGKACGYDFKVGSQYLIYANRDERNPRDWSTSVCSRTQPLRDAEDDLVYITRESGIAMQDSWKSQFRD
jgi:predicted Zn-ribbon and HTH transcriptional regulator